MSDYPGVYKAFVRDVADPAKAGRVRCYCPGVMGEEDRAELWLDWGPVVQGFGAPKAASGQPGALVVPEAGAPVWLMFEEGNPDFPVVMGSRVTGDTTANTSAPVAATGGNDGTLGTEHTLHGVTVPASGGGHSTYPRNRVIRTAGGHVLELDDTPGSERIRIRNAAGAWTEWSADGSLWQQVIGDFLLYSGKAIKMTAVGNLVLGAAAVFLGSASAAGRVVRDSALMAKFNAHTHALVLVPVVSGITPVGTASGVTATPSVSIVSPTDFYTKPFCD